MLKKIYIKKLTLCAIVLFSIFLIYLMPNKKDKLKYNEELEYVNNNVFTSTIYLLDANDLLASTKIITKETDIEAKSKELIESLIIDGPMQDNIPNGFKAVIPANTKILDLKYNNGVIKINFSNDLMNTDKSKEEKIIEAITYTLTSIDNIEHIIIYMEGEILTKLPKSKINLPSTLDRNFGINKEYDIKDTNNIEKTTIYYISEFNSNKYYIPVTKVNNDTREKIEIIIDELSSSNLYKTNLMSYLNNNTKLLSVNENDDELILNFNSAIFNNISTKEILEEVIYTISMSINDNYNVNTVVFNVEDEKIYKSVLKTIE